MLCALQNLGAWLLWKWGNHEQKQRLREVISGEKLFTYSQPIAHFPDRFSYIASAKSSNGGYLLESTASWAINAEVSHLLCVFAQSDEKTLAFLLERDAPGMLTQSGHYDCGAEGRACSLLHLSDALVPESSLIGDPEKGLEVCEDLTSMASCLTAARCVGIAQGALDFSLKYARQREQFGKPIGEFQAIKIMLGQMAAKIEGVRHLVYRSATVLEEGQGDGPSICSIAKSQAAAMALEVTSDAVQIGGGYGYTRDYPLERMMRNAQLAQILDGNHHMHHIAVAQSLLDRR
jgi:alkylation response protein AidB-like acyl-CoA dehydrogenase